MKSVIVLLLIVVFMFLAFLLSKWLQQLIKPRQSFGRLMFYFLAVLMLVGLVTFFMVMLIAKLYPSELMK